MHWKGTVSRAPQPLQANTGLPAPIDSSKQVAAGFDVQRFEAVANQLVANGRIPGLAMAIVKDGQMSQRTRLRRHRCGNPQAGRRAHRVPPGLAVQVVRRHHHRHAGQRRRAALGQPRSPTTCPEFRLSLPNATQQVTVADVLSHRVGLTHNAFDRDLEGNAEYYHA
jgi:beta-lactamase class C